eukprot:CAMPEP_0177657052 /NCGR_PEP_ID=MMETSP0447-20121125/15958_1 /TAXON_ID=0 /ORGANISM="Stygamoeba regulata, Strain BSH-02190019" /LENGTH=396 /DNA_ID=CAMNT_0019161339 /DNA_START=78 /DNA_END=1265 /DNA_ORIENTATION=-
MADHDAELKLKIPLKDVYEEFQCPICFEPVNQCLMTPCGHNFCEECLDECLNRKKKCPCCNAKCTREQCVRNHHFNKVASILEKERDIASKRYFERLLGGGGTAPPTGSSPVSTADQPTLAPFTLRDSQDGLSPIEECFRRHLTKTVLHYQRYCQQLEERVAESATRLREEFAAELSQAEKVASKAQQKTKEKKDASSESSRRTKKSAGDSGGSGGKSGASSNRKRTERAKARLDEQLRALQASVEQSRASLLKVFDEELSKSIPKLEFLPITVSIYLEKKDIMLPHTVLQPVDSIESVHVIVQRLMAERGDAVVDMSRCTFYLRQPGATKKDDVHLDDIHRPIATWKPAQGSILVVKGRLKSASDQKKVCFSRAPFEEGVSACDYFTCQECKLNW